MDETKDIKQYIEDTIMGRPYTFCVGGRYFNLYPITLGKAILLQRLVLSLDIDQSNLRRVPSLEVLRIVRGKKRECLTIISYHTFGTAREVFDSEIISERVAFFEEALSEDDIVSLMITVLTTDRMEGFMKHLGLNKEQEKLSTVMRIKSKNDKNNLTFGGKSLFGSLIDAACERYGWTKEYVVWGIDYASLRLMLADKVSSVYCSDDEMKRLPSYIRNTNDETIKPTKENMSRIIEMDWR